MLLRCLFAAGCFLLDPQPGPDSAVLGFAARSFTHENFSPPVAYRDVVICSYLAKNIICHRIAHAYRPLPSPLHTPLHRRK